MALIRIDRNPPARQLRRFGLAWFVAFVVLGAVVWRRGGPPELVGALWALASLVPAAGWFYLPILRWAHIALAYATFPIGWVVSHVILALIYFAVLTPIGLLMRALGRDPMNRQPQAEAATYWRERSQPETPERYLRQF